MVRIQAPDQRVYEGSYAYGSCDHQDPPPRIALLSYAVPDSLVAGRDIETGRQLLQRNRAVSSGLNLTALQRQSQRQDDPSDHADDTNIYRDGYTRKMSRYALLGKRSTPAPVYRQTGQGKAYPHCYDEYSQDTTVDQVDPFFCFLSVTLTNSTAASVLAKVATIAGPTISAGFTEPY